jgi:hypothetical protein
MQGHLTVATVQVQVQEPLGFGKHIQGIADPQWQEAILLGNVLQPSVVHTYRNGGFFSSSGQAEQVKAKDCDYMITPRFLMSLSISVTSACLYSGSLEWW